jgi:hypothetical protein
LPVKRHAPESKRHGALKKAGNPEVSGKTLSQFSPKDRRAFSTLRGGSVLRRFTHGWAYSRQDVLDDVKALRS